MTRSLLVASVFALSMSGCAENRPQDVLSVGQHQVDILGPVSSKRHVQLNEKFMRAIDENPEWRQYVQAARPGEPLPYDPRCGLSKAEFDELLALSNTLTTAKVGEGTLTITLRDGQVYLLEGRESLSQLTGIEIDLRDNVVRTPIGVAKDCSKVDAGGDSILGAWSGTEWTLERAETDNSKQMTVTFAVGKLADSGRGVMCYRVKEGGRGGKTTLLQIVTFDLPLKK